MHEWYVLHNSYQGSGRDPTFILSGQNTKTECDNLWQYVTPVSRSSWLGKGVQDECKTYIKHLITRLKKGDVMSSDYCLV